MGYTTPVDSKGMYNARGDMCGFTRTPWASGILSDRQIQELALKHNMISPFVDRQVKENGIISYGLSSYGYDARVANKFKIFTNTFGGIVDPKNFSADHFVDREGDVCIIPPNSFVLATTIETFNIPDDVLVTCIGKSTYSRIGLVVGVTPLEPGWTGEVTLEFSNTTPLPVMLYANEGACQFIFSKTSEKCETTYADRKGKYQNQKGITLPRVFKESHSEV